MESPASEAEVQALVRGADQVRCVATGHSFSPVCLTGGTLLRMDRMSGITGIEPATGRVTALAGTPISAFGLPLWDAGLALGNQGDIDTQGIAGAVATATHGSGLDLQSFSATVRRVRLGARRRRQHDRRVVTADGLAGYGEVCPTGDALPAGVRGGRAGRAAGDRRGPIRAGYKARDVAGQGGNRPAGRSAAFACFRSRVPPGWSCPGFDDTWTLPVASRRN